MQHNFEIKNAILILSTLFEFNLKTNVSLSSYTDMSYNHQYQRRVNLEIQGRELESSNPSSSALNSLLFTLYINNLRQNSIMISTEQDLTSWYIVRGKKLSWMKLFKVLGLQIIDERLNVYCLIQIGLSLTQSLPQDPKIKPILGAWISITKKSIKS